MKPGLALGIVIVFGLFVVDDLHAASDIGAAVARGRQTYIRVGCYLCHGYEAQGGAGPRLAPQPMPLTAISAFVHGTKGEMPAYGEKVLSASDLSDIYAFLSSVPRPKPADEIPALRNLK